MLPIKLISNTQKSLWPVVSHILNKLVQPAITWANVDHNHWRVNASYDDYEFIIELNHHHMKW